MFTAFLKTPTPFHSQTRPKPKQVEIHRITNTWDYFPPTRKSRSRTKWMNVLEYLNKKMWEGKKSGKKWKGKSVVSRCIDFSPPGGGGGGPSTSPPAPRRPHPSLTWDKEDKPSSSSRIPSVNWEVNFDSVNRVAHRTVYTWTAVQAGIHAERNYNFPFFL